MKKLLLTLVLLFISLPAFAASRYWVGGGSTASWTATTPTNWSASSNGSNNASVPGASDDAIFDGVGTGASNSTAATISLLSLNFTGYANTVTAGGTITVAGNVTLSSGMTIGAQALSMTTGTLTSAGKTLGALTVSTGTVTLADSFIGTGAFIVNAGATLAAGSNTITISNDFNCPGTITGTETIVHSGSNFYSYGKTLYNYTATGDVTMSHVSGAGNTFNTLTLGTGARTQTFTLVAGDTQTVTTLVATGASGKVLTINTGSAGNAATISQATGTVSGDYMSIKDSTVSGGAAFYAGANSTNVSGNTGWIFTAPPAGNTFDALQLSGD